MTEDRPTLIYYVQTVLNTFKRDQEVVYTRDKHYAIELLEKAMEHQNDIWNDAIEEAAKCYGDWGEGCTQDIGAKIRELKK